MTGRKSFDNQKDAEAYLDEQGFVFACDRYIKTADDLMWEASISLGYRAVVEIWSVELD